MEKSKEKLELLERIKQLEAEQKWNEDAAINPPTFELFPNKVDYLRKGPIARFKAKIAFKTAQKFFEKLEKQNQIIIKEVRGLENLKQVNGGAIITCNHFNAFDNYALNKVLLPYLGKRPMYKVIREGNYTNPPSPFGFFFKNAYTLPLSSNFQTMKKFMKALGEILGRGDKVLVYPEQGMWWNYRKPRPLKNGAFNFAVTNNVPVIPCFITMEDTEFIDGDGFNVQAYTIHILPAIYPSPEKSKRENIEDMKNKNLQLWVKTYEEFYNIPYDLLK